MLRSSGPRALEMFAHCLVGEIEGGVSLASLVPCTAVLPDTFGKARIHVTGDYPFSPRVGIRFEKATGNDFAVEFRDPPNAELAGARLNGKAVSLIKNDRGFYRVKREWKDGIEITLDFQFLLASHVIDEPKEANWIAFAYGPWALAQTIEEGTELVEPFLGKDLRSEDVSKWLEPCAEDDQGGPTYRITGTEIQLGPFYTAGGRGAGSRTYFQF